MRSSYDRDMLENESIKKLAEYNRMLRTLGERPEVLKELYEIRLRQFKRLSPDDEVVESFNSSLDASIQLLKNLNELNQIQTIILPIDEKKINGAKPEDIEAIRSAQQAVRDGEKFFNKAKREAHALAVFCLKEKDYKKINHGDSDIKVLSQSVNAVIKVAKDPTNKNNLINLYDQSKKIAEKKSELPFWRRYAATITKCVGLAMLWVGVALTCTGIGAAAGVPLMIAGGCLFNAAIVTPKLPGIGGETLNESHKNSNVTDLSRAMSNVAKSIEILREGDAEKEKQAGMKEVRQPSVGR